MNPDEFRADLRRRLAIEPFIALADRNGTPPDLAERLGVTAETVAGAMEIARGGGGSSGPRIVQIDVFLPQLLRAPFLGACDVHRLGTAQILRSLLHAVLLTEREPSPRVRARWGPAPGCEAARARLEGLGRSLKARGTGHHLTPTVSAGLLEALKMRALAHQVKPTQYAVLWVADLIDGLVPASLVVPVEASQTFVDARQYVLPVLRA